MNGQNQTLWLLPRMRTQNPSLDVRLVLAVFLVVAATAFPITSTSQIPDRPQDFPRGQKVGTLKGGRETSVGIFMRAERRPIAEITQPFEPSRPTFGQARSDRVFAEKDSVLLILHFSLRPGQCAPLDRQRLFVKDDQGKSYRYGGWRVDDGAYSYCGPAAARIETGPWGNTLWSPVAIRPELGFLDLVYQVDAKATKLTFTDGNNVIELDPMLKPPDKERR